jgi:hypothetical protein
VIFSPFSMIPFTDYSVILFLSSLLSFIKDEFELFIFICFKNIKMNSSLLIMYLNTVTIFLSN